MSQASNAAILLRADTRLQQEQSVFEKPYYAIREQLHTDFHALVLALGL